MYYEHNGFLIMLIPCILIQILNSYIHVIHDTKSTNSMHTSPPLYPDITADNKVQVARYHGY